MIIFETTEKRGFPNWRPLETPYTFSNTEGHGPKQYQMLAISTDALLNLILGMYQVSRALPVYPAKLSKTGLNASQIVIVSMKAANMTINIWFLQLQVTCLYLIHHRHLILCLDWECPRIVSAQSK